MQLAMSLFPMIVLMIFLLWLMVRMLSRGYKQLFSETHLRELHTALGPALTRAQNGEPPQTTAFETSAGLCIATSCGNDGEDELFLHLSLSQAGRLISRAVASRMAFFCLAALWDNQAELDPYFTPSGVHHLAFRLKSPELRLADFDTCYSRYRNGYRPLPFRPLDPEGPDLTGVT